MAKALLATLILLLCARTHASTPRLAVVEVHTPPNMMGLGQQVTRALETHAQAAGHQVLGPDALRATVGSAVYDELRSCGPDLACAQLRTRGVPADLLVWGSLTRDSQSYLLKLWLLRLPSGTLVADADRAVLIASRRFVNTVDDVIPRLLRGEREPRAVLEVQVTESDARLFVDGTLQSDSGPSGTQPRKFELPAGPHKLRVEKPGFLPVERMVNLEAGQAAVEKIRLLAIPGLPTLPPQVAAAHTLPPSREEPAASSTSRIPTPSWISWGVAAAAGGAGLVFGLCAHATQSRLERGYDPQTSRYGGTRAEALSGQKQARIANLLLGLAGVSALTGGAWWWADGGGHVSVSGQF